MEYKLRLGRGVTRAARHVGRSPLGPSCAAAGRPFQDFGETGAPRPVDRSMGAPKVIARVHARPAQDAARLSPATGKNARDFSVFSGALPVLVSASASTSPNPALPRILSDTFLCGRPARESASIYRRSCWGVKAARSAAPRKGLALSMVAMVGWQPRHTARCEAALPGASRPVVAA